MAPCLKIQIVKKGVDKTTSKIEKDPELIKIKKVKVGKRQVIPRIWLTDPKSLNRYARQREIAVIIIIIKELYF